MSIPPRKPSLLGPRAPHAATIYPRGGPPAPHAATVSPPSSRRAAVFSHGVTARFGAAAGGTVQAMQRTRRASAAGKAKITVMCWNLEHFRPDKHLAYNADYLLTQFSNVDVAFFLEAKRGNTAAALEEAAAHKVGLFTGSGSAGSGEVVIYAARSDTVASVTYQGRVKTGGETRDPVLFDVKLKTGETYRIAAWHAPGPTTTSVAEKLRTILKNAVSDGADLLIGDINVAGRDRSEDPMLELTPDQSSTITDNGPTNKEPIDRVWFNSATSISTSAWFGSVPGGDYAGYKGSISNHLPLYITLYRLK
jgi:hypothetical protein